MARATAPAHSRHRMARAPRRLPAALAGPSLPTTLLWPPALVQSFSETPSLHHAADVHGATGCVSRLKASGHVARASACDLPAFIRMPTEAASLDIR